MRLWRLVAAAAAIIGHAPLATAQTTVQAKAQATATSTRPQATRAVNQQQQQPAPPTVVAPTCAAPCRQLALRDTKCSPQDQKCLCTDPAFAESLTACVKSHCTIKESLIVRNASSMACGEPVRSSTFGFVILNDIFATLASLFVLQRFAFKIWTKAAIHTDDWISLVALVSSLPSAAFNSLIIAPNGLGRDTWTLSFEQITTFIRFFSIVEIIYFLDIAIIKLALLFFYLRIFASEGTRRVLIATIVFDALFGISFFIVAILQCKPINYAWEKWDGEHEGKCLDITAMVRSHAVIGIALDLWMLAIPLWQLRHLNIDWKRKVSVGLMFFVGTLVTIVSILRLWTINFTARTTNPTRDFLGIGLWSMIEINVGIMCVCMPSLRLLLVRLFPRLQSSTQRAGLRRNPGVAAGAYSRAVTASQSDVASRRPKISRPFPSTNQIHCEKTYSVEYDDDDERRLVGVESASSAGSWRPKGL